MDTDALTDFAARLRGPLIGPGDERYGAARAVYNAMHDHKPAVIVQTRDVADVVAAVNFAREQGLLLAVRGGGHSVPGFGVCDDGLVLDLGPMNGVLVDAETRTVHAQGGCTLADLDHATHAYGLAVPSGTVSSTGLGGLALGGGMGHLSRAFGLTCDNLLAAEVVTAGGEILQCDAERHADLFWAIRGGGGNFGVVTRFTLRAHPVDTVYGGPTFFRVDGGVMGAYESLITSMPEALNAVFAIAQAPPAPFVPEDWHFRPVMAVLTCWSGDGSRDEEIRQAVTDLGEVVGQALWRMPYPEINTFFDELLPAGMRHYWKPVAFRNLSDKAIAAHVAHGPRVPNLESGMFAFPINGACHRVGPEETAFANRDAEMSAVIFGAWQDASDDEEYIRWVRAYFDAVKAFSEPGGYVNFMSGDDQGLVEPAYDAQMQRLQRIKGQYDPENLFRLNQNIAPEE